MVLDLGSGCGASAIAAKLCGATYVVANDIDTGKKKKQNAVFIHSLSHTHKQPTLMCFFKALVVVNSKIYCHTL